MVSLMVILFRTKYFLFVYMYMYIDLLKLQAFKLFENSDADLSWLFFFFFLKKPTCLYCHSANLLMVVLSNRQYDDFNLHCDTLFDIPRVIQWSNSCAVTASLIYMYTLHFFTGNTPI